ncbi:hypothetical protein BD626DRAFT_170500 [Schizophyllum amplum]|uniref:Uncharacterized protein n=1 Tax=Schizophyllum amplum TaxID=97359 RepID=A0A550CQZ4_9AGAR|nr:hypothetical protein BD626DRAFT_170500 [Auriculariopsis ampla]
MRLCFPATEPLALKRFTNLSSRDHGGRHQGAKRSIHTSLQPNPKSLIDEDHSFRSFVDHAYRRMPACATHHARRYTFPPRLHEFGLTAPSVLNPSREQGHLSSCPEVTWRCRCPSMTTFYSGALRKKGPFASCPPAILCSRIMSGDKRWSRAVL